MSPGTAVVHSRALAPKCRERELSSFCFVVHGGLVVGTYTALAVQSFPAPPPPFPAVQLACKTTEAPFARRSMATNQRELAWPAHSSVETSLAAAHAHVLALLYWYRQREWRIRSPNRFTARSWANEDTKCKKRSKGLAP